MAGTANSSPGNLTAQRNGPRSEVSQGKGNMLLFPAAADRMGSATGEIHTRERVGGLLKFYHREAA